MDFTENSLPIDLVLADQLFPVLEGAAKSLANIPQFYEDADHFFWRNFLELFPDPSEQWPPGRIWEMLALLRDTAETSIVTAPLVHLSHNNDRINAAVTALAAVLKK